MILVPVALASLLAKFTNTAPCTAPRQPPLTNFGAYDTREGDPQLREAVNFLATTLAAPRGGSFARRVVRTSGRTRGSARDVNSADGHAWGG